MPGMDGTGPRGLGPGTGWGRGPCVAGARFPRRRFWRFGRGRGFRRSIDWEPYSYDYEYEEPATSKEDEKNILEKEAKDLELELKRIRERLKSLE